MKERIRRQLTEIRDAYDPRELDRLSERIKVNLFSAPEFMDAKSVMFYASKGSEVRTWDMILDAVAAGKIVSVPCTDVKSNTIEAYRILSGQDMRKGPYGIAEPRAEYCERVEPKDIDIVIVPGKAFDRKGERIGYGKGYYDRFLSAAPETMAIGLAYDFQLVEEIPSEEHDVRVSMIVTESKVVRI